MGSMGSPLKQYHSKTFHYLLIYYNATVWQYLLIVLVLDMVVVVLIVEEMSHVILINSLNYTNDRRSTLDALLIETY
jgi:hypothetical protein